MSEIIQKSASTSMPIAEILANRWSPRIFDSTAEVSDGDIMALAEAARWAPSSNNFQPWKFAFLKRGSQEFQQLSETALTGFNQSWAPSASLYAVVMVDQTRPDGKPWDQPIAYFNAGLAASQLVFQAEHMGLKAHYMGGIVHEEILKILKLSGVWVVNVIAIGTQGELGQASEELQARELASRERKPLGEIVVFGL